MRQIISTDEQSLEGASIKAERGHNSWTMPTSDDASIAYTAWTKAHTELREAEKMLADLRESASIEKIEAAEHYALMLREVSYGLLDLAHQVLMQHARKGNGSSTKPS